MDELITRRSTVSSDTHMCAHEKGKHQSIEQLFLMHNVHGSHDALELCDVDASVVFQLKLHECFGIETREIHMFGRGHSYRHTMEDREQFSVDGTGVHACHEWYDSAMGESSLTSETCT
jgi:hypothetical protein